MAICTYEICVFFVFWLLTFLTLLTLLSLQAADEQLLQEEEQQHEDPQVEGCGVANVAEVCFKTMMKCVHSWVMLTNSLWF